MRARISVDAERLRDFCRRHHILKLAFFGSVLRDDFGPDSDIDILADFEPDHLPGLIRLGQMEEELSRILGGRRLDLLTPKFLSPHIRDRVLADAEVQFAEG